jgi:hypothetical protein
MLAPTSFSETRRILCEISEATPGGEAFAESFSIARSAQQMSLYRIVLPDGTEARQERLRAFWIAKSSHAALAFTRRLMAVLGPIVYSCTGLTNTCLTLTTLGIWAFAAG